MKNKYGKRSVGITSCRAGVNSAFLNELKLCFSLPCPPAPGREEASGHGPAARQPPRARSDSARISESSSAAPAAVTTATTTTTTTTTKSAAAKGAGLVRRRAPCPPPPPAR